MRLRDASFGKYIGIPMRLSALKPSLMAGVSRSRGPPTAKPSVLALATDGPGPQDLSRADARIGALRARPSLTFLGTAPWRAR